MAKLKRKLYYVIDNNSKPWWFPKLKKWVDNVDLREYAIQGYSFQDYRYFKTAKKAFKHFKMLPQGSKLYRLGNTDKGSFLIDEWIKTS